jgi:hypothetical protein
MGARFSDLDFVLRPSVGNGILSARQLSLTASCSQRLPALCTEQLLGYPSAYLPDVSPFPRVQAKAQRRSRA